MLMDKKTECWISVYLDGLFTLILIEIISLLIFELNGLFPKYDFGV